MLKGLGTGVNETTFVGDQSQHVLIRCVQPENTVVRDDRGTFEGWIEIPTGTIATRIGSKKISGREHYRVMLPSGLVVFTSPGCWAPAL